MSERGLVKSTDRELASERASERKAGKRRLRASGERAGPWLRASERASGTVAGTSERDASRERASDERAEGSAKRAMSER